MSRFNPIKLIWTGFLCLAMGWAILFLIVIDVIPPSFFVAIGAYALSFVGLIIGLIGLFEYRRYGS